MFKWLKTVFTKSDKVVDDVFDKDSGLLVKAGGFINNLHYSEAEKAQDQSALIKGANEFVFKTLSENTIRSKTRRFVAITWIAVELLLVLLSAFLGLFGDMDKAEFIWSIATSNLMFTVTLAIVGFFFGNHILTNVRKG